MRGNFEGSPGRGLAIVLVGVLAGCANPGPPKPPSLHLPKPIEDLSAERSGNKIRLAWTTPGETTDGIPVQGGMRAEICEAAGGLTMPCTPVETLPAKPGPASVELPLSSSDSTGRLRLADFRLKLLNAAGRSAGDSKPAAALIGAAPPQVTGLHASVVPGGALLEWKADPVESVVELDRHTEADASAKSAPKAKEVSKGGGDLLSAGGGGGAADQVRLQAGADKGGVLDRTVRPGKTYRYVAERVEKVTIGGQTLEARSGASTPVLVEVRDIFPPQVPRGLEAVVATAATGKSAGIDLSWEPVSDPDVAGYIVYRQAVGPDGQVQGERVRLTAAPVQEPGYRDSTAVAGQRYAYTVSAVDTAGNESAVSTSALEEMSPDAP